MLLVLLAGAIFGGVVFILAVGCAVASAIAYERRRPQLERRLRAIEARARFRRALRFVRRLDIRPRLKARTA